MSGPKLAAIRRRDRTQGAPRAASSYPARIHRAARADHQRRRNAPWRGPPAAPEPPPPLRNTRYRSDEPSARRRHTAQLPRETAASTSSHTITRLAVCGHTMLRWGSATSRTGERSEPARRRHGPDIRSDRGKHAQHLAARGHMGLPRGPHRPHYRRAARRRELAVDARILGHPDGEEGDAVQRGAGIALSRDPPVMPPRFFIIASCMAAMPSSTNLLTSEACCWSSATVS